MTASRLLAVVCLIMLPPMSAAAQDGMAGHPEPVHAIAMHGTPKYGPGFTHFAYVNPNAPKGGTLRQAAIGSSFDTFNPFVIKGIAPAGIGLSYDTLLVSSADEPFTEYGLVADTVTVPEDRSWVSFHINPDARFNDGTPVTADDVVFSFNKLRDEGRPFFRFYYGSVDTVERVDDLTVTFRFGETENRELPLILGQLPVLPKHYWQDRDFSETTLDVPVTSGPYTVADFEPGRFIVYERNPDYWGWDLPVNAGTYNFDRIRYDYYRDVTVATEAFKAFEYDLRVENEAKRWSTGYDIAPVRDGHMIKGEFQHGLPSGMQGFAYNLRRPLFQDPRVRRALAYAFDFEWSNQNLFHGLYTRTRSFFDNSTMAAEGLPQGEELALLERFRDSLPEEVFTEVYTPPSTDGSGNLRDNLRTALGLLRDAGWSVEDGVLTHSETGEVFAFEILLNAASASAWERITLPFVRNLERLGIEATVRTAEANQFKQLTDTFDYDMIVEVWGQSLSPGNEQRDFWGSDAAERAGSRNSAGVSDPVIDELIEVVIAAPDRASLVQRVRALDRVLQWKHIVIPHWHIPYTRIVYWDRFGRPGETPLRGEQLMTWWIDPDRDAMLAEAGFDTGE